LRSTGLFLEKYGFKLEELYGRIQTNSTLGGLGQFYQSYIGTFENEDIKKKGIILSRRPVRLLPSFVPNSFLDCQVKRFRPIREEEKKWYRLYKISDELFDYKPKMLANCDGSQQLDNIFGCFMNLLDSGISYEDAITFLAISARLGVIE
jgi:hypothetical protein